jgi:chromate reductase, NAD(P)H dehydrogenase (quinone)
MGTYKIGYFVGSLSSRSINRVLSKALISVAPEELEFTEIPIKDLPLYSPDYDADYPPAGRALKDAIAASDGILFISPEYNRSRPRCPEECHRLGVPALGHQLLRAQANGHHRHITRQHRHGRDASIHAPQLNAPEAYIKFSREIYRNFRIRRLEHNESRCASLRQEALRI